MKKFLAILMVLVIIFAFAGCSDKADVNNDGTSSDTSDISAVDGADSPSDVSESGKQGDAQSQSAQNGGAASSDKNGNNSGSQNNSNNTTIKNASNNTTKKEDETKAETTTKRKIKLTVEYPSYNSVKTTVKIEYKEAKDKKYKELVEEEDITLDQIQKRSYDIKDKLIGDVDVRITLDGVVCLENDFVIKGTESEKTISLVTGTEVHNVGFD